MSSKFEKVKVNINIDIDNNIEKRVSFDEAKQLGLIINELITNVFKHAFNGKEFPTFTFKANSNKSLENLVVQVIDNGVGFNSDSIQKNEYGFGLRMIETNCSKLGWGFETNSENGTNFKLTINT